MFPSKLLAMSIDVLINRRLTHASDAVALLRQYSEPLSELVRATVACLRSGGTIFTCGNGGSAAEAMHLSEELVGRFRGTRAPFRSICLNGDPTSLTCIANDFGFDEVFARPLRALGRTGDLLLAFSTSGDSANVLRALETAHSMGITPAALLGGSGGAARSLCQLSLVVNAADSAAVQEAHQMVMHIICEALEGESGIDS